MRGRDEIDISNIFFYALRAIDTNHCRKRDVINIFDTKKDNKRNISRRL